MVSGCSCRDAEHLKLLCITGQGGRGCASLRLADSRGGCPHVSWGCPHVSRGCPHMSGGRPHMSRGCPYMSRGLSPHGFGLFLRGCRTSETSVRFVTLIEG